MVSGLSGAPLEPVNLCDMRMIERGQRSGLALELGKPFRVAGKSRGQDFQRDISTK
jgi:hypothetical protein